MRGRRSARSLQARTRPFSLTDCERLARTLLGSSQLGEELPCAVKLCPRRVLFFRARPHSINNHGVAQSWETGTSILVGKHRSFLMPISALSDLTRGAAIFRLLYRVDEESKGARAFPRSALAAGDAEFFAGQREHIHHLPKLKKQVGP